MHDATFRPRRILCMKGCSYYLEFFFLPYGLTETNLSFWCRMCKRRCRPKPSHADKWGPSPPSGRRLLLQNLINKVPSPPPPQDNFNNELQQSALSTTPHSRWKQDALQPPQVQHDTADRDTCDHFPDGGTIIPCNGNAGRIADTNPQGF